MPIRLIAAAVLVLEAAGLTALVVWQGAALFGGDTDSVASALALMVLTSLGAALLLAFAIGTARRRSWGRSGGIVAQVLILAVALGALTGVGADPALAAGIAAPGIIGLVLLLLAVRQAGAEHAEDGQAPGVD